MPSLQPSALHWRLSSLPKGMRGMSIVLITAGLLSLAFMGFSGVDNGLKAIFGN